MKPFRTLLFDLDGTLTDSKPGIVAGMQHALRELGREVPTPEELNWCIGPPTFVTFPKLLETEDSVLVNKAIGLYRDYYEKTGVLQNSVYPGVEAMLRAVSESFRMLIATSKPHAYAIRVVEHFGLDRYFEVVQGSAMDGSLSDKAELIGHLLREYAIKPSETLMIGDRRHDVIGAHARKIICAGALWGYGGEEELTEAGADFLLREPGEVVSLALDGKRVSA